jgi:hypothetical protein
MTRICLSCTHCKRIPLRREDVARGVRPLVRCARGRFAACEPGALDVAVCRDFDGEDPEPTGDAPPADRSRRTGPRTGHVNLGEVLPPDLLDEVLGFVPGPRMVYVPACGPLAGRRRRVAIRDAYARCGTIRGAARAARCSRDTVRAALAEKESGAGA